MDLTRGAAHQAPTPNASRTPQSGQDCGEDELLELQRRYHMTGDRTLRNELVASYIGLARNVARRFAGRGKNLDDLVQVASLALIHAVDRYDPEIGHGFVPFAIPTIVGELKHHFRDRTWSMRVSRRLQENYFNSMFEIDILTQELGRAPTYTEISQAVGVSEDQIVEALEAGRNLTAVSLDKPIRADGRTTEPTGQVDSSAVLFENRCFLAALAKSLTDRERRIIELRFVVGMTQTEIGRTLGISQMQVSRLLRKSLARMRDRAAIG